MELTSDTGDDEMTDRTHIAGALYGVALGDALGKPTEFMQLHDIHRQFGHAGVMALPRPALITDDTQMTLRVARAIGSARRLRPHKLTAALRREFIEWATRDVPRAPGVTCLTAIHAMRRNPQLSWIRATVADSKGCGANMRVAPTAFIRSEQTALGASVLQAAMTHGHPTAIAATELTALAIRWSSLGMDPSNLIDRLLAHAVYQTEQPGCGYRHEWLGFLWRNWSGKSVDDAMYGGWLQCIDALVKLRDLFDTPPSSHPVDICKALGGGGWIAEEALTLGLYFAICFQDDPELAVSEAARTSGDSDSIASITGAIIGAYLGEDAWPSYWRDRIERKSDIEQAIDIVTVAAVR